MEKRLMSALNLINKHAWQLTFLIIIISFSPLLTAGCSDSDTYEAPATEVTITDAEWTAFQDGDGPWEVIEIPDDGTFIPTVTDSQGRYGIVHLVAKAETQSVLVETLLTTTTEMPQLNVDSLSEDRTDFQVRFEEAQNIDNSDIYMFFRDDMEPVSDSDVSNTFQTEPGIFDLFITQTVSGNKYPSYYIARLGLELDETSSVDETITTEDFNNSEAFSGPYTITVQGESGTLDSSNYSGWVNLLTANLTEVELGDKDSADSSLQYSALASPLSSDDIYLLVLDIVIDDNNNIFYYEGFQNGENLVISPPIDALSATFEADTSTGNLIPGVSGITDMETGAVIGYMVGFNGSINDIEYTSVGFISGSRIQSDTSFTMPDFSSAEGWNDDWSMPADITTNYTRVSAQIASDSSVLQSVVAGFFHNIMRLDDGDWMISVTKTETNNDTNL